MKNEKANVRCGSERYVCAVCAETKNSQVYLGYYSSFICDCGYRREESAYAGDYRMLEYNTNNWEILNTDWILYRIKNKILDVILLWSHF